MTRPNALLPRLVAIVLVSLALLPVSPAGGLPPPPPVGPALCSYPVNTHGWDTLANGQFQPQFPPDPPIARWFVETVPGIPASYVAPVFQIPPYSDWVSLSNAEWVNPYGLGNHAEPVGLYYYDYLFLMVPETCGHTEAHVHFSYAAEDEATIYVDGVPVASTPFPGWKAASTVDVTIPLAAGEHSLQAVVNNHALYTGFIASGSIDT